MQGHKYACACCVCRALYMQPLRMFRYCGPEFVNPGEIRLQDTAEPELAQSCAPVCRGVSVMEDEGQIADHTAGISATDGAWHHIAVTWQSSDGATTLYDNGRKARAAHTTPSPLLHLSLRHWQGRCCLEGRELCERLQGDLTVSSDCQLP